MTGQPATDPIALSLAALDRLPANVARPAYARAALSAGILHIGVGNFHRAHMAVYLDELMNRGEAQEWAIVGAGITAADSAMRERLAGQDWLNTIIEQDAEHAAARVTGVMIDFIDPADRDALVARLADPAIHIVSLTVTEGGYFIDPRTGAFDASHPAVVSDAADPQAASTVFGLLLRGIGIRRAAGVAPFTVMSCDNVPHNGAAARNALVGLARLSDPGLADWIDREIAFPNAMVDRITPAAGDRERSIAMETFGVRDAAPVFCEPFRQWVIEDRFTNGRPELEKAGAIFTPDVTPFELMKIRILNGGHAVIAYPAALLGITFVHEAMADPLIAGFLDRIEREEILPHVLPPPGVHLYEYLALVQRRFANPKVGDTIRRLCFDGSNRQPKFIVPSVEDAVRSGSKLDGLALVSALWCRYCAGKTDAGDTIEPNDPEWTERHATAVAAQSHPECWVTQATIFGTLGHNERFQSAFSSALSELQRNGVRASLNTYLES